MNIIERRSVLKTVGLGALAATMPRQATHASEHADKVVLGIIGTGGMGSAHLKTLSQRNDFELAYVCDVDQTRLAEAAKSVETIAGTKASAVADLRKVLDDHHVDAVLIATPDHWHTPAALVALDAGKHVYVEKPCCHNVREGRLLVEAAKRSGKVLQVGTQSRSAPFLQEAMQRLREGAIGEVLVAKAWNSQRRGSIGKTQPSQPPAHLDFDRWLGPAPAVPYRANMLHGIWRWWYDFGCGDIGNDGIHDIDVALWGLGVKTLPSRVTCLGGKNVFDDDQQFPDTQYAVCEYPLSGMPAGRSQQLIFEQRIWSPYVQEGYENGVAFYGTKGMMVVGHMRGWKLYGERNKLVAEVTGTPTLDDHYTGFLSCIRGTAKQPAADAQIGYCAAAVCHLANISARVGRTLNFNTQTESIDADPQASELLHRRYRAGYWAVPRGAV